MMNPTMLLISEFVSTHGMQASVSVGVLWAFWCFLTAQTGLERKEWRRGRGDFLSLLSPPPLFSRLFPIERDKKVKNAQNPNGKSETLATRKL